MGVELEGRELDAAVAEEIFDRPPSYYHCPHFDKNRRILSFCSCPDLPRYSRDIAAAMQVVEKLVADGYYVDIGIDKYGAQVQLNYYTGSEKRWTHGESLRADTLPLAICRAARMAAEAE